MFAAASRRLEGSYRNPQLLKTSRRYRACMAASVAALAVAGMARFASAASLTWDSSGTNAASPVDGSGTWDTSSSLWSNGSSDIVWPNDTTIAVFGNGGTAGTVTLGTGITAGGLIFNPNLVGNYVITGNTLTLGGSIIANTNATINSNIAGTSGLTVTGAGTVSLGASNSYAGTTTLYGGNLNLDFTQAGAPTTNIVSSSSPLAIGGGTLTLTGLAGVSNSQTFAGTMLNAGAASIQLNTPFGSSLTASLGAITRNPGSTVNFSSTGTITTTTANSTLAGSTILGGYAVFGGNSWAVSGSGATAGTITGLPTASYSTSTGGAAANNYNLDITTATGGFPAGTPSYYSIRMNAASTINPAVAGGATYPITSGGILETANVGANSDSFGNTAIFTSGNGSDLIVTQNDMLGTLQLPVVADNARFRLE